MRAKRAGFPILLGSTLLAAVAISPTRAQSGVDAYRAMGLRVRDVLTGTILSAKVLPGEEKQTLVVTTYLTGKREKADAVNVRLAVLRTEGKGLVVQYERDFGAENGGYVGQGDLQIVDLDLDGLSEIVVTYDDLEDPLIRRRMCEVIVYAQAGFRTAWSGLVEYDATRAARQVPQERRDRFKRELDIPNTLRTRGVTLFFQKTVIAVAGEPLPEPKIVQETFPLREAPEDW